MTYRLAFTICILNKQKQTNNLTTTVFIFTTTLSCPLLLQLLRCMSQGFVRREDLKCTERLFSNYLGTRAIAKQPA
jgi:hypothetical protein